MEVRYCPMRQLKCYLYQKTEKPEFRVAKSMTHWGLVILKDLPFAAACLGDMFDVAQTNQP